MCNSYHYYESLILLICCWRLNLFSLKLLILFIAQEEEYIIPVKEWKYLQMNLIAVSTKHLEQIMSHLDTNY